MITNQNHFLLGIASCKHKFRILMESCLLPLPIATGGYGKQKWPTFETISF